MDNSHKSSCPICQRWFMVLFLKSWAKELALTVFPVNMKNPEPEFKEYHAQPPVVVLVQENVALTDNLRIEQYINSRFTSLDLTSDKEAEQVSADLYIVCVPISARWSIWLLCSDYFFSRQKFNAYLKAVDDSRIVDSKEKMLLLELKRLNDFIEQRGTKFLSGNEMTLVDCDLMPKLQHVRIAGKVSSYRWALLKDFYLSMSLSFCTTGLQELWNTRRAGTLVVLYDGVLRNKGVSRILSVWSGHCVTLRGQSTPETNRQKPDNTASDNNPYNALVHTKLHEKQYTTTAPHRLGLRCR